MAYEKPAADGSSKTEMAASLRKVLALPFTRGKKDRVIVESCHNLTSLTFLCKTLYLLNRFFNVAIILFMPFQRLECTLTKWREISSGRASTLAGIGWTESHYVETSYKLQTLHEVPLLYEKTMEIKKTKKTLISSNT